MRRLLQPIAIPFGLALLAVLASACAGLPGVSNTGAPAAEPTDVAAKRPDTSLTIAQPPAGATLPVGRLSVTVTYKGPALVPAASASELNQYHLNYLLDVDSGPYLQRSVPIPLGNASIIHTSNTQVVFEKVAAGSHLLAVVLTGSNRVSPNPPVAQQISCVVK
jgi:hypothetical protein